MLLALFAVWASVAGRCRRLEDALERLRGGVERLEGRLDGMEGPGGQLDDLARRAAPPEEQLTPVVTELEVRTAETGGRIDRLEAEVRRLSEVADVSVPAADDARDLAAHHLREQGYHGIEVVGEVDVDRGTQVRVRGLLGAEVRYGHVLVAEGEVLEADLSMPVTLFP